MEGLEKGNTISSTECFLKYIYRTSPNFKKHDFGTLKSFESYLCGREHEAIDLGGMRPYLSRFCTGLAMGQN